jgi:hypothetical protein
MMQLKPITLRDVFSVAVLLGIFILVTPPLQDPDLWWHLRTGQYIVETGIVPESEPGFAYTNPGKEWVTMEWLSEVFIFQVYQAGGGVVLALVFGLISTMGFYLAYLRSPGKPYIAGFSIILGVMTSKTIMGARPQIFTFAFASIYIYLLEKYFETLDWKKLIPLPIVMVAWVNAHGGYAIGLAIIIAYLAGKFIEQYVTIDDGSGQLKITPKVANHGLAPVFYCLVVSILTVGIGPHGMRTYIFPVETLLRTSIQEYISEWLSPNFHDINWLPLAFFAALLLATSLLAKKRMNLTSTAFVAGTLILSLRSKRQAVFFSLFAPPVLAEQLTGLFPALPKSASQKQGLNIILLVLLISMTFLGVFVNFFRQADLDRAAYPIGAVEWIKLNRPEGNMYNYYAWGGYLIYHLYPEYKVYIDGRSDLHGDLLMREYVDTYSGTAGWQDIFKARNINMVIIEPESLLAEQMRQTTGWEIAYEDTESILFIRQ